MQKGKEIFVDETERKPNLYAANVLSGVVLVIVIVCCINEVGVFTLDKLLMRICLAVSVLQLLIMQVIVHKPRWTIHPASKYVIMGMVLFLVLTLTVLLNVNAILAYVIPILLAPQFRSKRISLMALAGSCFCCCIAPILSYFLDTWNLEFLTGYIQTFCRVTIEVTPGSNIETLDALSQITLYWSLPQILTLGAFGVILYSATKMGIDSVTNQIHVVDLSESLNLRLESILAMQEKVLYSISDIIESRDIETGGHVKRTSEIVRLIMGAMQCDPQSNVTEEFCRTVIQSAPMHDLGKIAVPDAILRKPGKLTDEEYEIVKQHSVKSMEIIEQVLTGLEDEKLIITAKNMARSHHERWDGTGYPDHLVGMEIPLEARIMAVADVYDALVSERCYKEPMCYDVAYHTIMEHMGTQFDPGLRDYFAQCRRQIEKFYRN